MEKILNLNTLGEGALKRSALLFNQKLIKLLPDYFTNQQTGIIQHSSFAEIVFPMNEQCMLENFTSQLEEKLHVHVLYASREEGGKEYKVIAYSSPVEDEMYIIYLSSTQYGVVDSLTVFFFDSIETMYCQLLKERNLMPKIQRDILEKEPYAEMLSHFN